MFFLLGLVGGYLAWQRWGPLAGVVGFVLASGVGWAILNMAQAALRFALNPSMYRQSGCSSERGRRALARYAQVSRAASHRRASSRRGIGSGAKRASQPTTGWTHSASERGELLRRRRPAGDRASAAPEADRSWSWAGSSSETACRLPAPSRPCC